MKKLHHMYLCDGGSAGGLFDVDENAFTGARGICPFHITAKIYDGYKAEAILFHWDFSYAGSHCSGADTVYEYVNSKYGITVKVHYTQVSGASVVRTHTEMINDGKHTVRLSKLTSVFAGGIFGNITGRDRSKLKVHLTRSMWCGEGQRVSYDLDDMHVDSTCKRESRVSRKIISRTSYTTDTFLPVVFFTDEERDKCWYLACEPQGAWEIAVGIDSKFGDDYRSLTVSALTAEENTSGYYIDVGPHDSHVTPYSAFGCTRGGVEEGVAQLDIYRREIVNAGGGARLAVVFNDYMNCLWARPCEENTKRLVDAAAQIGAEVYCMDSGWYKVKGETDWFGNLGDWVPNDSLFGEGGFAGIIDYVRQKGMKPGMWFELEMCTPKAAAANKPEDWFLHCGGKRVYESGRYFFDFRNAEVREYLIGKLKYFYDLGIRYIKNDYNGTFGGCECEHGDPIAGLESHALAVKKFFAEVRARFPDMMIENCGSGAMRADYTVLSHCDLQSVSDLELFERYPAVVSGSLMSILPEQTGVWCVCYPQEYADMNNENFADEAYVQRMADGEQTVFNMVSGFMGEMMVSGRIDLADKKNLDYVREAVALYKQYKPLIRSSSPVWPCGPINYSDHRGIKALALKSGDKMLLALWRLEGGEQITLPLGAKDAALAYPKDKKTKFTLNGGNLTVKFDKDFQARLFEIKL